MKPLGYKIKIALLAWLAIIGFDFFLHGGVLARFYTRSSDFLLSPEEAFRLIPLGYLALLLFVILLFWLMTRIGIEEWKSGLVFGLKVGILTGGASALGLISISTVSLTLVIAWSLGQVIELGISGIVLGSGLAATRLRTLMVKVIVFFIITFVLGVAIQSIEFY